MTCTINATIANILLQSDLSSIDEKFKDSHIADDLPSIKNAFRYTVIKELFASESAIQFNDGKIAHLAIPLKLALKVESYFGRINKDHLNLISAFSLSKQSEFALAMIIEAATGNHLKTIEMILQNVFITAHDLHWALETSRFETNKELSAPLLKKLNVIKNDHRIDQTCENVGTVEEIFNIGEDWGRRVSEAHVLLYAAIFGECLINNQLEAAKYIYSKFTITDSKFIRYAVSIAVEHNYSDMIVWLQSLPLEE